MIRILFISDTHLGFDLPFRPRVERRRRGPDFFRNFERSLELARKGGVDLVIHGGDVLYRSRVRPQLVQMAFAPLKEVADAGVPVYVVPGNHERSHIPSALLAQHPGIHIYDRPRTYVFQKDDVRLALAGFPYAHDIRARFKDLVRETGLGNVDRSAALLLMHHCVEGARVGPANFRFGTASDVVRAQDIPNDIEAVLSGHIHRAQALTHDLAGRPLAAPVLYPGSTERTSFAEAGERKGYLTLAIEDRRLKGWRFHELPARPMARLELGTHELSHPDFRGWLRDKLRQFPTDGIVHLRLIATPPRASASVLSAGALRALAPPSMNLSVSPLRNDHHTTLHDEAHIV